MESLIHKLSQHKVWDNEPVFCFTSDIDWASEAIMQRCFDIILPLKLKPTLFLTHESDLIKSNWKEFDFGIHPNFLPDSSHGEDFRSVIEHVKSFTPGSIATRSHRGFDVTDTSHLLYEYGYRYSSNWVTQMQTGISPVLHESGLINVPVFWEDGTHLYNSMDLFPEKYFDYFKLPGIKVISIHPTNLVLNPPTLKYMRLIKDSLTRTQYNNLQYQDITHYANPLRGIADTTKDIIEFVKSGGYKILSLKDIYNECIRN